MLMTRLASLILRAAQFVFAAVVLGLSAYFLYQRNRYDVGPLGRVIYGVIISSLAIIFSIIWMIPTKSSMTGYASDLFFTAAWAAVFGVYVRYFQGVNCGSAWSWGGISLSRSNHCGQWKAAQAFSFLSMIVWFASFVFGVLLYHRLSKRNTVNEGPG
ncbi:marvel domain-containing protein [Dendryphion nanum]|uniref:Marvel domain-containing protein n=1 Tax=Dendryphion nanum TaxID=256645 RepID=A0A9P9DCW6_9PLEO|nr:marvel domain-containing protein [Dendryphion nanum]